MRLYLPMHSVENIQQLGTIARSKSKVAHYAAVFKAYFVHSNIRVESTLEPAIDYAAIERQARAARNAWIGSKLKSYYQALVGKFERAGEAERENFLGASQALAELEERIRREERRQSPHA